MDTENKLLCSKREAAMWLSLSLRTIDNLLARKELTPRKVGRRTLIPYRALLAFARRDHVITQLEEKPGDGC